MILNAGGRNVSVEYSFCLSVCLSVCLPVCLSLSLCHCRCFVHFSLTPQPPFAAVSSLYFCLSLSYSSRFFSSLSTHTHTHARTRTHTHTHYLRFVFFVFVFCFLFVFLFLPELNKQTPECRFRVLFPGRRKWLFLATLPPS